LSYGPVRIDAAGAVYVAGTSKRGESGRDWAIIKYKPEGDQEWVAWHSGLGIAWDHPNDMLVSACGEVWVTGAVTSDATGKDLTTIKYNRLGEEAWVATYDGPGHSTDVGLSLALDSHCNVWVAGMSNGTDGDYDWVTIRHDSTGQQLAVGRYEGVGGDADVPWALVVDDEGSAYVTGKTTVIENDSDIATIKYSVVTGACEHDQAVGAILMTPNPFSRRTTVRFTTTVASTPSRLDIYDVRGQLVTRLFDGRESGQQVVTWDGTDMQGVRVSSGVYFARLDSGPIHRTHKVVLLR
jgi:hypothetical protein